MSLSDQAQRRASLAKAGGVATKMCAWLSGVDLRKVTRGSRARRPPNDGLKVDNDGCSHRVPRLATTWMLLFLVFPVRSLLVRTLLVDEALRFAAFSYLTRCTLYCGR